MEANSHELHRLFAAKADGTITPEEHERLSMLLQESAAVRQQWFAFQDAEAALLAWSQRETMRREEGADFVTPGSGNPTRRGGLRYLGALAAGIVIGLAAWAMWPNLGKKPPFFAKVAARDEATTSSVAVLSRGVNMQWDYTVGTPALNAPLPPGLLRLRSGVAEIEFFQGARLCVEGPAEIQLISAGEAFCRYGRFSAHVPRRPAVSASARPRAKSWISARTSAWISMTDRRSCTSSKARWSGTNRRRRCGRSPPARRPAWSNRSPRSR
ncbi:MAG: hypothetical protein WDN28_01665 [Chthoniobacter sp.]